MRILLINHQIIPETSGVASHFDTMSKTLLKFGHQVERLVIKNNEFKSRNKKIKYHYFEHIKKRADHTKKEQRELIKSNNILFNRALKKINFKKIERVITSSDTYVSNLKEVVDCSQIFPIIPSSLSFLRVTNPDNYRKVVMRIKKNLKNIRAIVLSQKMKNILDDFLDETYDISVVYPGVDLNRFSKKSSNKNGCDRILYVGRIAPEKNISELFQAVKKMKNGCRLTIVGGGGHNLSDLKKFAKRLPKEKKVFFKGRRSLVEKYYSEANFFILPSKMEAFGLVILEAMAAGLPVIAFKPSKKYVTASDEIIVNGSNGFLVKNVSEMSEKIDLLLKNTELQIKMGKNARNTAEQFSWEEHVKKLLVV